MWHDAVHIERTLGVTIAVDDAGGIDLLTWDYPPHPASDTAHDLARSVGVEA